MKRTISPDGGVREFAYDGRDRLISETDGAGNTRTYTYDANSDLTKVEDFYGGETLYAYTDRSHPGMVTVKVSPPVNSSGGPRPTTEHFIHPGGDLYYESFFSDWNADPQNPRGLERSLHSCNRRCYDSLGRESPRTWGWPAP